MQNNPTFIKSKLVRTENLGNGYFKSWFYNPHIAVNSTPGQFVMIQTNQFLFRPLSVSDVSNNEVGFLYKIFGEGTKYLASLKKDDEVYLNGPLGKGFQYPSKNHSLLAVAGGIGIATFPYFLKLASQQGYKITILYGARSKNDLISLDELGQYGELEIITDDGSSHRKGYVSELLEEKLSVNKNYEVYICGPTPMLKSANSICVKYNIYPQISFEEYMCCGYGVCMSCVVKNTDGTYIRTCIEGPVIKSNFVEI